ncbi:MAG: ribonuclease Z [Candidatus Bathyarchaeota archaeon]|nr:ribonuclease Z [Candidatus Bathyarchaeota archaeon]
MSINVIFLGTAGSVPTLNRSLPAIIIKLQNEQIMFDCGEGTQRQILKVKIGFHKKMKILISHLHGDHVLGLPGLLQTMALMERQKKIEIYGPKGIKHFLECTKEILKFGLTFPVEIIEIYDSGIICEEKNYTIKAIRSSHTETSLVFGYIEKPRPGKFYPEKARALGVPESDLWSKLQEGKKIKLSDGRVIKSVDVTGPLRKGRKIVYTGDTRPIKNLEVFASKADLLIHESTFDDSLIDKALVDGHSTPYQAANEAKKAKVKKLILTHISARYPNPEILLRQAQKIFQNTIIAKDLMELELPLIEN